MKIVSFVIRVVLFLLPIFVLPTFLQKTVGIKGQLNWICYWEGIPKENIIFVRKGLFEFEMYSNNKKTGWCLFLDSMEID